MKLKSLLLLVCALSIGNVLYGQNPDSATKQYYSVEPSYTKGGYAQNGFRLKKREVVYTNTLLFMNTVQFGLSDFFSLGGTFMLIPLSGVNGWGAAPFGMVNAKVGYDFGRRHHFSISTNIVPANPVLMTPTVAYSFGRPGLYIGLAYMVDNIFNERNYLLLQSGFGIGKHIVIASEFILMSERAFLMEESSYYSSPGLDEKYSLLSIMAKITPGKKKKFTLNAGYFLYDMAPVLNAGFSIRLNRRKG